jgi:hypothetical protein
MSDPTYRQPSEEDLSLIRPPDRSREIGLAGGGAIAALVAFIFGTCLFVSLDAINKRHPAERPVLVSGFAKPPATAHTTSAF